MKRGVLIGSVLIAAFAGTSAKSAWATDRPTATAAALRLADVDPSNGIDEAEARAIAEEYFGQEYGDCGGPDEPRRTGRTWVFTILFGLTGEKLKESINVDAKTGGVSSAGGPRYRTLQAFRRKTEADQKRKRDARLRAVQPGVAADGAAPRR